MPVYTLNPSLQVIVTSPDEVVFRGGQFDTFSVVVSTGDLPMRGAELVELLTDGLDPAVLPRSSSNNGSPAAEISGPDLTAQLSESLDRLVDLGVARRTPSDVATDVWLGFRRFGSLPSGWAAGSRFDVYGEGGLASGIADLLRSGEADFVEAPLDVEALAANAERFARTDADGGGAAVPSSSVAIVVGDGASISSMHAFNKAAVDAGCRALWVQSSGSRSIVGPYVIPGMSPCYWEWERSFARSMFEQDHYRAGRRAVTLTPPAPPASHAMALAVLTPSLVELATLGDLAEPGAVLIADAGEPSVSSETCLRVPRCPVCAARRAAVRAVFP